VDKPEGVRKIRGWKDNIEMVLKETQRKVLEQWHRQGVHETEPQGSRRPRGFDSTKH